jgi:hypothetical protein
MDCKLKMITAVTQIPGYGTEANSFGTLQVVQLAGDSTSKKYACADVAFSKQQIIAADPDQPGTLNPKSSSKTFSGLLGTALLIPALIFGSWL